MKSSCLILDFARHGRLSVSRSSLPKENEGYQNDSTIDDSWESWRQRKWCKTQFWNYFGRLDSNYLKTRVQIAIPVPGEKFSVKVVLNWNDSGKVATASPSRCAQGIHLKIKQTLSKYIYVEISCSSTIARNGKFKLLSAVPDFPDFFTSGVTSTQG